MELDPKNNSARVQADATSKLIRKIEFERAIASADEEPPSSRIRKMIADGACEVEKGYAGPKLDFEDGVAKPSDSFVRELLDWFKEGKLLPKRYVFEVVLGCQTFLREEQSMTEYTIPKGETCDMCVCSPRSPCGRC